MKAEIFIEKLFRYLEDRADSPVMATGLNTADVFPYVAIDNKYGDKFVRIRLSKEKETPPLSLGDLFMALADIAPDGQISTVDIDDGTVYDIFDVYGSSKAISIIIK